MNFPKLTIAAFAFAILTAPAPAAAVCSNTDLKGLWGYYHGRPLGIFNVYKLVGQFTADGQGNLIGSWTLNSTGAISTGTFTGSYAIAENCTGTLTFSTGDQSPANFNIVLDAANQGFQMIQSDNGYAQSGFGMAQGAATCGQTGKKEVFAANLLGVLYPSDDIEDIVGQLEFNGKGNISGSATLSVAGTISSVAVTGTYTESADCSGTVQITPAGFSTMNFNTVVVSGGHELLLIETDSNTFVAGTAQGQGRIYRHPETGRGAF
jgi:hypothetical protein